MTDLCPYASIVVDHVLRVDGGPVPHGQWEPQAGLHHGDGFLGAGHSRDTTDVEHPQGGTCHWPTRGTEMYLSEKLSYRVVA